MATDTIYTGPNTPINIRGAYLTDISKDIPEYIYYGSGLWVYVGLMERERIKRGLTFVMLADLTGYSDSCVRNIFRGLAYGNPRRPQGARRRPLIHTLRDVAQALRLTLDDVMVEGDAVRNKT